MADNSRAAMNTDRELWRESDSYYAPSVFVTEQGAIGIQVGGLAIVKTVTGWHNCAQLAEQLSIAEQARAAEQPCGCREAGVSDACCDIGAFHTQPPATTSWPAGFRDKTDEWEIRVDASKQQPTQPPAGDAQKCFHALYDQDDGERFHCQLSKGHQGKHSVFPDVRKEQL